MAGGNYVRVAHSFAPDARVALHEFHASVSSLDMALVVFLLQPLRSARAGASFLAPGYSAALDRIVNLQQSDDKATLSLIGGGEGRDD